MSKMCTLLFGIALVVFIAPKAHAQCVDTVDLGDEMCSDGSGCESSHPIIECTFGCISGTCNSDGNGGRCCGEEFSTAQITHDGEGRCNNVECGGEVTRRPISKRRIPKRKLDPELAFLSYRPPQMVFVPSRCEHAYEMRVENSFCKLL